MVLRNIFHVWHFRISVALHFPCDLSPNTSQAGRLSESAFNVSSEGEALRLSGIMANSVPRCGHTVCKHWKYKIVLKYKTTN